MLVHIRWETKRQCSQKRYCDLASDRHRRSRFLRKDSSGSCWRSPVPEARSENRATVQRPRWLSATHREKPRNRARNDEPKMNIARLRGFSGQGVAQAEEASRRLGWVSSARTDSPIASIALG